MGNITNITDALGGHYVMAYGPRNERLLEQNQDTNRWNYAYDELLRLKQQTDPNGVVRTPTYDAAGRPLFVDFSTGRRDSFVYDDNDSPKTVSRRVSGVTTAIQFIYDSLDRVIEQDDALGKTVLYGYDPLGRATSITYSGGKVLANRYDALGRLTNQVDWASRQTRYAYDAGDRLVRRSYPNGVVQTNAFDTAGRIASLSYSTPNPPPTTNQLIQVALTYAYDRNGNKTGGGESGTFGWPLPSLTDDNTRFTPAGRLINRQTQNNSVVSNQMSTASYNYDASGNMTNASGGGQSWALTYDEDNRTTSIAWEAGITSKHISNRYDALGRRVSRTVDGVTTGYVLSLAGGMERILCDLDGSGNATAWYVHGPDLCYKVDATNGLTCYHADAMANTIALTDGNTNLVAQYAYTPYGRSLGSTNVQAQLSNPYLFAGSQGVMEEIPGLYFMRARYYSSDAGVFLSTDPVKNIGPGWKPIAYRYGNGNPLGYTDPKGEIALADDAGAFIIGWLASGIENVVDQSLGKGFQNVKWDEAAAVAGVGGVASVLNYNATVFLGPLGLAGAKTAVGSGEAYLKNGIKNLADGRSFNEAAGGSLVQGGIGGLVSYGMDQNPNVVAKGLVGRPVEASHAVVNYLTGNAGVNSAQSLLRFGAQETAMFAFGQGLSAAGNMISSSGGGGTGSSASQSMSSRTPNAGGYAFSLNLPQQTQPALTANSTPMLSTSISSGSGSRSGPTATSTPSSAPTSSGSSTSFLRQVGNFFSGIGNFFSGIFGGGRP